MKRSNSSNGKNPSDRHEYTSESKKRQADSTDLDELGLGKGKLPERTDLAKDEERAACMFSVTFATFLFDMPLHIIFCCFSQSPMRGMCCML